MHHPAASPVRAWLISGGLRREGRRAPAGASPKAGGRALAPARGARSAPP